MNIIPGNAQHIGARAEQQDAFGFSDIADKSFTRHGGVLAVVADGMGGLANGREASNLAVRTMLAAYAAKVPTETIPAALYRSITEANRAVYDFAHSQGKAGGVGTTLIATVLQGEELHWISAGDSRIYMIRDGRGTQINTDHVYARELRLRAARGEISADQARNHPEREALTSFLGDREIAEVDRSAVPVLLKAGDRLLLCTDGLYRAVPENEMVAVAVRGSSSEAAEALVARALAARIPNQDNATVALLAVPETAQRMPILPWLAGGGVAAAAVLAASLYMLWPSSDTATATSVSGSSAAPVATTSSPSTGTNGDTSGDATKNNESSLTEGELQKRLLDKQRDGGVGAPKPEKDKDAGETPVMVAPQKQAASPAPAKQPTSSTPPKQAALSTPPKQVASPPPQKQPTSAMPKKQPAAANAQKNSGTAKTQGGGDAKAEHPKADDSYKPVLPKAEPAGSNDGAPISGGEQ